VNPDTQVHTVYDARDRSKPLWSFSKPVWHNPFLLSNDGTVVATVAWQHVKIEYLDDAIGVTFWSKDGVFGTYLIKELCPDPPKTQDVGIGPIGDFWRTWYTTTVEDGESFTIRTTRGTEHRFRFSDGKLVESRGLGLNFPGQSFWLAATGVLLAVAVAAGVLYRRWRRRRNVTSGLPCG
jgi:hypothetical protein